MVTRMRAAIVSSAYLAMGCVDPNPGQPENSAVVQSALSSKTPFLEGGSIPYVFGFSPDTGQIFGGKHQLLIPQNGSREVIDNANQPWRLHPGLNGSSMFVNSSIQKGEAQSDAFASNWWPQRQNGIADRWNSANKDLSDRVSDPDNLSPAEKYDLLFYPGQIQQLDAVKSWSIDEWRKPEWQRNTPFSQPAVTVAGPVTRWELQSHGLYQRTYPEYWWGHCNGWSAYVTAEPDAAPRRDVRVKLVNNKVTECAQGEGGCVFFRMADLEALMSELYFSDSVTFSGSRCETRADRTQRDIYGRPIDPACRDINAGTMHVAMTGLLGVGATPLSYTSTERKRLPFIVDYTWDVEVWSFPVEKFAIDVIEEVSPQRAAQLVCNAGYMGVDCQKYRLNPDATRFARVAARYWMISDSLNGDNLLLPPEQRNIPLTVSELHYVLELDARLMILGGEWIKNPALASGVNGKEMHPDYLWMPIRAQGAGEDSDDLGGTDDNPYVAYSKVKSLLTLSRTAAPPDPAPVSSVAPISSVAPAPGPAPGFGPAPVPGSRMSP